MFFTTDPFAELAKSIPVRLMQAYVVAMVVLVASGTLFDTLHKGSAKYFANSWRKAAAKVRPRELVSLALRSTIVDVMMSGEFCNLRRRVAHLLTMYGFVIYLVATITIVFWYPAPMRPPPAVLPTLWHIGALMVCGGGYWFWFFIRVDVVAEGNSPFRIVQADLFVLTLLASVTTALIWSYLQSAGYSLWSNIFLGLYLIATTASFGSVLWSKFAHMFYKPAAAFARRVEEASGQRRNLPTPADKLASFGSTRRQPRNY
jgi:hypothetical protein